MPENMTTPDLCLLSVQQNGEALKHVPDALKTVELCRAAVSQNGHALCFVNDKTITAEQYTELCWLSLHKEEL
ncbi:hypothetical protein FACS1894137_12750 [Spirochaetia bacterium]|nr:hypothetical protein FACS1894137_12750 [Spirochaetia bacterium]